MHKILLERTWWWPALCHHWQQDSRHVNYQCTLKHRFVLAFRQFTQATSAVWGILKICSSDCSSTNDIYWVYLLPIAAVTDDHVATPEQHTLSQFWGIGRASSYWRLHRSNFFVPAFRGCSHSLACGHSSLLPLPHHFSDSAQYC